MERDPIQYMEKAIWDGMRAGGEVAGAAAKPVAEVAGRMIDVFVLHKLIGSENTFVKRVVRPVYMDMTREWRVNEYRKQGKLHLLAQ